CQSWNPAINHGQINIPPGKNHVFRFVSAKERTTYYCTVFYQLPVVPNNKSRPRIRQHFALEAFRAGTRSNKCGQYREWCARHDAIYFRRNPNDQLVRERSWTTR
ncbi:hypothetical protein N665_6762s0001, partial [Sinapis alba]